MASVIEPVVDLSTLSLYKLKTNPIHSLESQNQRRKEVLKKQKEKREQQISQLRFLNLNESQSTDESEQQPKSLNGRRENLDEILRQSAHSA